MSSMLGGITPNNWRAVEALIDRLLDAAPERRATLLTELSGGDAARRGELEQLIVQCEADRRFLERPAMEHFAGLLEDEHMRVPEVLAGRYRIQREVGRGGMAIVYLAQDEKHARHVAVKVVRPELAAALGRARFLREIEIAAKLHHPHIVSLYDSGEADGLVHYVMPYEEGQSLRQKLERGQLSVLHAARVLRDVADALAYAHNHGVVHRDIKPENVLLADRHALVTDFGIAKALREATDRTTLTTAGITLGTPAYMAPEQIAGDVTVDHRADIYSFGCLAYEALTAEPPFAGLSAQEILAAHLSKPVPDVRENRSDVPAALAELVSDCLAKSPSERPQSAAEIVDALEAVISGLSLQPGAERHGDPAKFRRALLVYAGSFVAVAIFAWLAMITIGLPSWVLPGALVVMGLGLPVVLFTGLTQQLARRETARLPGSWAGGRLSAAALKAGRLTNWRRTVQGGVWAMSLFVLVVVGYMTLRALGIGPVGSLLAKGAIKANEPLLIADFESPPGDSTLGIVVTEALRTDLSQSKAIVPVQVTVVRETIRRLKRPPDAKLDFDLAREVATSEGIKAVLAGEVLAAGRGYVIAARLVSAASGDVLAAFRQSARDADDVIPAIDRLSGAVRARVGESLRSVHATPPLYRVTTGSLEALRKFTQGSRIIDRGQDNVAGIQLIEEAVALDTAFGSAYRKLAATFRNLNIHRSRQRAFIERAFAHRDRMSESERAFTTGDYYLSARHYHADSAIIALKASIELGNIAAGHNNLGEVYTNQREFAKAVEHLRKALAADSSMVFPYGNLYAPLAALGRWNELRENRDLQKRMLGASARIFTSTDARILEQEGRTDSARRVLQQGFSTIESMPVRRGIAIALSRVELRTGRLRAFEKLQDKAHELAVALGDSTNRFVLAAERARALAWFHNDTAQAAHLLDSVLTNGALGSLDVDDRPYLILAEAYAMAARTNEARALAEAFDRLGGTQLLPGNIQNRRIAAGLVALAKHRMADAIHEFRAADTGRCIICALPHLARAYDLNNQTDSAIAVYERYLSTPMWESRPTDAFFLAPARKRLGELYEAKGDLTRAATHYAAFVDLWKDADPELQPSVRQVRQKLNTLERARSR